MKRTIILYITLFFMALSPLYSQRSFDEIFPDLSENHRRNALADGVIQTINKGDSFAIIPARGSGVDLHSIIAGRNFPYITESLIVIPNRERSYTLLDAYNALGNIQDLKGRLYPSHTRGQDVPLFEEASRVESDRRNNPIPDPPPALVLPSHETVYIRLRDVNFGNTYYRSEITPSGRGLLFNLTNYRNISLLFFTIMRAENFTALLYMEPIQEGMLIYSVAGTDVSDFAASLVDIPSAISKRLHVFVGWVYDGLMR